MLKKSDYQLAREAVRLFPITSLSDPAAVRQARRKWINAVHYLRDRAGPSAWVCDNPVPRQSHAPVKTSMLTGHFVLVSGTHDRVLH